MSINFINLFQGVMWLAVVIMSALPYEWARWTGAIIAAIFSFAYFKGYFDGRKF